MKRALKALGVVAVVGVSLPALAQQNQQGQGQQVFRQNCAVCHGNNGGGGIGPALAGNNHLKDVQYVVNQILHGGGGMPTFGNQLSNEQIAAVATYVRTSWGNDFDQVSLQQVRQQGSQQTQQGQEQQGQQQQQEGKQEGRQLQEGQQEQQEQSRVEQKDQPVGREVIVKQEPGKAVFWILPGPRQLSEQVFGTPDNPLHTGEHSTELAQGSIEDLFMDFPIIAGVPLEARATNEDNTKFTQTTIPTPVSDKFKVVSGQFNITYKDRQPYDIPSDPDKTLDEVDLTVSFTDPEGNEYQIEVTKLYQPPFPGFESGGGVVTDTWLHGSTGTDSPLFPKAFTYGAFWGVGNIIINGEVVDEDKWVHFMTTQVMRNNDYELAVDEELPLKLEEAFAGQLHHTHVVVRPIKITPEGPVFEPVSTAFKLPNGENQPFIHLMFEEDTIIEDAFKGWSPITPTN